MIPKNTVLSPCKALASAYISIPADAFNELQKHCFL
jgi:hypothetical protein